MAFITPHQYADLAFNALAKPQNMGKHPRNPYFELDVSGNCSDPKGVPVSVPHGKLPPDRPKVRVEKATHPTMLVRCRRCDGCRKAHRAHWWFRMTTEMGRAIRTWFGTLTFSAENQFRFECLTENRLRRGGTKISDLSTLERWRELTTTMYREVQLMFKRLRKAGARVRYLVVFEAHKSGKPHIHLLIHETGLPVRHRALVEEWPHGFVVFKLVAEANEKAAGYVAKYLSKGEAIARVRASAWYGRAI